MHVYICNNIFLQGQKKRFNLSSLNFKTRHLGDSALLQLEVPEQALGGIPLDFGIVVEDN